MSKDNGFGIGLFPVAYFGRHHNQFSFKLPDVYIKKNGIRSRAHLPEIVEGLGLIGLITSAILHFAR